MENSMPKQMAIIRFMIALQVMETVRSIPDNSLHLDMDRQN